MLLANLMLRIHSLAQLGTQYRHYSRFCCIWIPDKPVYESGKFDISEKKEFYEASNSNSLPVDFYTVSASTEEICAGTSATFFIYSHTEGRS